MARANRHYIPGQVWHLTHRCHKREFLLKLVKDRRKWLQWLFEAKRRYSLIILNYTVTSNHIHLLVLDEQGRDVIPQSIKLVAGRTAQEYNLRKNRKGAFWEDRYHAIMIKEKLGQLAKGRKIFENDGGFQLREKKATYIANFDTQKDDIVDQNTYLWDINI